MTPPASVIAHVQSGKLRALGVTGNKRLPILKDVPTIVESVPNFTTPSIWYALLVPVKTPRDIVNKLNADTRWALGISEVSQKLAQTGVEAMTSTPEELRELMLRDNEVIHALAKRGVLKKP